MQVSGGERWAKCDMLYTFGLGRLSLIEIGRDRSTRKRRYETPRVDMVTLQAIRRAVATAVGIDKTLWP